MGLSSIGQNIRHYRLDKKLRQDDLAEKAGVSINYIGSIERGEKLPALELVRRAVSEKIGKFTKSEIMELVPSIGKASVENSLKKLIGI